jgi:hypothetical protein
MRGEGKLLESESDLGVAPAVYKFIMVLFCIVEGC